MPISLKMFTFTMLINQFVSSNEIINASESCETSPNGLVYKHTTVRGIFNLLKEK